MDILFLSHTYWDSVFRVSSHHLATQMVAAGHHVFYISTPISPWHALKYGALKERFRRTGQLIERSEQFASLVPLTPVPAGIFLHGERDVAFCNSGRFSTAYGARLGKTYDLIFVDDPKLAGLLPYLSWRKLIYRPTDVYARMGMKNWDVLERWILRHSNSIIATAAPVADFLRAHFETRLPTLVQVNGVDLDLFRKPQPRPPEFFENGRKRCVYVGALDFRFDFDALHTLAMHYRDIDFFVIGPFPTEKVTDQKPQKNLHWLGPRAHHAVPAYLQHADIGLLPLAPIQANAGRSPMKIYEYLAAGLPVVALETDELARRNTSGVFTYRDKADLIAIFARALGAARGNHVDETFSWPVIARRVLEFATAS